MGGLDENGIGDRVVTMVASEFGRRPRENINRGTDHGYASIALVAGDPIAGGVYGTYPSLDPAALVFDGNLAVTTDFRSVYATLLERHLGLPSAPYLGGTFPLLGFL